MEHRFADLFSKAQAQNQIGIGHDACGLARRYQSDLLGMRISAERPDYDAAATALEIAQSLSRL
jgi:hypothetical protein